MTITPSVTETVNHGKVVGSSPEVKSKKATKKVLVLGRVSFTGLASKQKVARITLNRSCGWLTIVGFAPFLGPFGAWRLVWFVAT